jgi:transcription elongation factor SPT4
MARKGTATVKTTIKGDKHVELDSDDEKFSPVASGADDASLVDQDSKPGHVHSVGHGLGNVDAATSRELLNPSKAESGPKPEHRQPRQASATVEQSSTLERTLSPESFNTQPVPPLSSQHHYLNQPSVPEPPLPATRRGRGQHPGPSNASANPTPNNRHSSQHETMAGGAYIPPNQQRNMRACMVCSVVRTQQQFLTQGCPNCEEFLELAGNPEQINDCTSQVFEGLITVADTSKSWVARYQRLEGYQPGVYATQVEGILPDDIIGLIESAGINYVPRDGSEQEMLPKD